MYLFMPLEMTDFGEANSDRGQKADNVSKT